VYFVDTEPINMKTSVQRTAFPWQLRRAALSAVVVVVVIALGLWYFRSSDTRLTMVPKILAPFPVGQSHRLPKTPRSVVIVVEENKSYKQIFGDADSSPYLNALAKEGAVFTRSYGVAHPSQPNYFAMFSGQTNKNGDSCSVREIARDADNLGAELLAAHRIFRAYVEDLPRPGFTGCSSGQYARKHAPWTHFTNVPAQDAVPFSALTSYDTLPDVAFVIPNLVHDMHSASIESGDAWLHEHIAPLVAWAKGHNALVVITWDESSSPVTNHIPTLFVGPMVKPGRYDEVISHGNLLRTVEDIFGLRHAASAATASPILDCWTS